MKPNLENKATLHRCLRLGALMAALAVMAGIALYVELNNKVYADEQKSELSAKLADVNQANMLLQQLNHGCTNRVMEILKSKLASDLDQVAWMTKASKPEDQEFANRVVSTIARDEKAHPDYYLLASSTQLPKPAQPQIAEAATPALKNSNSR